MLVANAPSLLPSVSPSPASRRPRHHRSGYTLVEMLVVISVNSVLMAAAVTLLAALVKSDRSGQQHCERTRALVQLAEQFRDDVATASDATIATNQVGETLRLRFGDERTVEYVRDGKRIRRLEHEGSAASSREAYSLAELSNATFGISEDKLTALSLTFTDNMSGFGDAWHIEAPLARDRRFAGEENRP